MGRFVGWTLGVVTALAISVAPAAAQSWSVGVHIGGGGPYSGGRVYYPPPVYRAPVYRVPVYDPYYYEPYYEPYYRPVYRSARPVYRDRVVIVGGGRYDGGRYYGRNDRGRYDRGRGYDRHRHGGRGRGRR
jgi:hypothetical protein